VRPKVEASWVAAHDTAKREFVPFEAVLIRLPSGGYNLRLRIAPWEDLSPQANIVQFSRLRLQRCRPAKMVELTARSV
jgi:hypothetical protein